MKAIDLVKLIISIILCQLAGFIGSIFTGPSIQTWYVTLKKPVFAPPNWLFAPVWITLYLLMGIAAYLIWRRGFDRPQVKTALTFFAVQLILNILWSPAFFGLRSPIVGLIVIIILWIAILLTIRIFIKLSTVAGVLLIPYILWVSVAAILNFSILLLNM
jgi:tryptophan-rich sensory protein